ncbi:unnamed protein product [Effrenium voratum]|uniref:D-aminoacyl-tRNA deacylase n=1 Tax=Effrenium voratum TaxID=2562239 RepID=A0AA36IZ18_9DINO|nr:unnamed protein product [Effrenium voratum]
MKLVIQRVTRASVQVDQKLASKIGRGLLVLLGIEQGASRIECARWLFDGF